MQTAGLPASRTPVMICATPTRKPMRIITNLSPARGPEDGSTARAPNLRVTSGAHDLTNEPLTNGGKHADETVHHLLHAGTRT